MILHITTERNKSDLEWLQQTVRLEQVIYDKRQNNLDQFIKTEIRKYAAFSHLILDSNIFDLESTNVEEFIRSISYLCSAYIGIIGDNIAATEIAGVKWFIDLEDIDDRQRIMRWIVQTDDSESETVNALSKDMSGEESGEISQENKTLAPILFFKKLGMKIGFVSLDDYDQQPALELANTLAAKGAHVSYSLISRGGEQLRQLAQQFHFEAVEEGYRYNGVDYYVNAADEDAHFILFDLEQLSKEFVRRSNIEQLFVYTHEKELLPEQLMVINELAETINNVIILVISPAEEESTRVSYEQYDVHYMYSIEADSGNKPQPYGLLSFPSNVIDEYFLYGHAIN